MARNNAERAWQLRVLLLSCLTCALVLGACSKKSEPASSQRAETPKTGPFRDLRNLPGTVFQVTYTTDTVRIDLPTVQRTLRSVSDDARVLLFDASDARIREMTEGKVMFLEHIGVRRVIGKVNQGSQVAIVTETAALTDFIQDGRIEFSVPVNFRRALAQAYLPPSRYGSPFNFQGWFGPPALVYASEGENKGSIGLHVKGEVNNWEFELKGEPEGEGVSLEFAVGKKLPGLTVSIKAKGDVSHINTAFKAVIRGSKLEGFDYKTPLQGKLHVSWGALTSGENQGIGEARLKLPPFAKDVFEVYGLPFLFRVDEALIFKPGFGGKKDAAEGGFDLVYNGLSGFSVQGGKNSPVGTMQAESSLEKTTAESLAAHGVVLAVNAPKVSISLGTESFKEAIQEAVPGAILNKAANVLEAAGLGGLVKAVKEDFFKIDGAAYVQLVTEFDYAGSGPLSILPCTMNRLNFFVQAGADAQFLAIKGESPKLELMKVSKVVRDPDIPACGEK